MAPTTHDTDDAQTTTELADLETGDRVTVTYATAHGNAAVLSGKVQEVLSLSHGFGDAVVWDSDADRRYRVFGTGTGFRVKSLRSGTPYTVGYSGEDGKIVVENEEVRTDGGEVVDDTDRLTNADVSEGDVVEFDLADGRTVRYRVREEWTDENLADGMTPGLHAEYVWTSDVNLESPLPRYRATLDLDAGRLVDNYPDADRGDVPVRKLANPRLVDVADRWEVRGSVASPAASHVLRVVSDALENDPLASTIEAENVLIKGADESGTGVLGGDLGLTIYLRVSLELPVREALESYLHENLNAGYWWELERDGVFTFLVDREGETHPVR